MKKLVLGFAALSLIGGAASPSLAAACRNKAGKFIKCPPKPATPKVCRDSKGHFTKCK